MDDFSPDRVEPSARTDTVSVRLRIEPLNVAHLDELASVLLYPAVFEHLEGGMPDLEMFKRRLSRAIAGPGPGGNGQIWLNHLVRHARTGAMLGRLEATVHDSIAEVAFLFGPAHWGNGYATEALGWLHAEVTRLTNVESFWATTLPANLRCQRLLQRSGYSQVGEAVPMLYTYAPGDLVFRFTGAALFRARADRQRQANIKGVVR